MYNNGKITAIVSYLDKRLKDYVGNEYTFNNITLEQCEEIIENLSQDHSEKQLFLIEKSLEAEVELCKQTGFKQTMLSMWGSIIISFFVAVCTVLNLNIQIVMNLFGKVVIDNSKNKQEAIDNLNTFIQESFRNLLEKGMTPFFAMSLLVIAIVCYIVHHLYNKKLKKRLIYYSLIKQCVELMKEKPIEEGDKKTQIEEGKVIKESNKNMRAIQNVGLMNKLNSKD
ncbi:hypothetical protein CN309_08430 [Bacillus thuringiensis]|uniref:hypothetical protein n=1 Tax=Bacillus thuringiensis TaxID=1428 RepID=UPI000BF268E1|nr:hypothetical protein [Bacillus thuringiensis]PFD66884.1 hypothetical protein CN309_08430 [Bacillus thuringiensis]